MRSDIYTRAAVVATGLLASTVSAAFDAASKTNVVTYWGQGDDNIPLSEVCNDASIDTVVIGFVTGFPKKRGDLPTTNFGDACWAEWYDNADGTQSGLLKTCPEIRPAIKECQANGKKVLLSIGGDATPNDYALETEDIAKYFAEFLWGAFGPLTAQWKKDGKPRPFGDDVSVDGFDLDIESKTKDKKYEYLNYDKFVNHLKNNLWPKGAPYYISAAPQCLLPDAHLAEAISKSHIDFVFVQFYNTAQCSNRIGYKDIGAKTTTYTFDSWVTWLNTNSFNKNIKLYMGAPAGLSGAGLGNQESYLTPKEANKLISTYAAKYAKTKIFGGVMLWEATVNSRNTFCGKPYSSYIKDSLLGRYKEPANPCPKPSSSSIASSTRTSSASSTRTSSATLATSTKASSTLASSSRVSSTSVYSSTPVSSAATSSATSSKSTAASSSSSSSSLSSSKPAVTSSSSIYSASSTPASKSTVASSSSSSSSSAAASKSTVASSSSSSPSSVYTPSAPASKSTAASSSSSSSVYIPSVPASKSTAASSSSSSSSSSSVYIPSVPASKSTAASSSASSVYIPSETKSTVAPSSSVYSASAPASESSAASSSASSEPSTVYPVSASSTALSSSYSASGSSTSDSPASTSCTSSSSVEQSSVAYPTVSSSVYTRHSHHPHHSSSKVYPTGSTNSSTSCTSSTAHATDVYSVGSSSTVAVPSSTSAGYVASFSPAPTSSVAYPVASSSKAEDSTTYTTSYIDICSTGFTTITTTITKTGAVPSPTTGVPEGWYTTVTVCNVCGPVPTTVTLTKPKPTYAAAQPTADTYVPGTPAKEAYVPQPPKQSQTPEGEIYTPELPKPEDGEHTMHATSTVTQVITLTKVPVPYMTSVAPYAGANSTVVYKPTGAASSTGSYPTNIPAEFQGAASRFGVGLSGMVVLVVGLMVVM